MREGPPRQHPEVTLTHRLAVSAATVLTAVLGVAGCSSAASTTTSAGGATPAAGPASTAPPSAAPTSTAPASTAPAAVTATGSCRTIDRAAAAGLLGFPVKAGIDSNASGSEDRVQKLDGCLYLSDTSGSLGYTMQKVPAAMGPIMISTIQARMAAAQSSGSPAKPFPSGLPQAVAFTMALPGGIDAQVALLTGERFITVAVTRKDGNAALSQAAAVAVTKELVAAG